MLFIFFKAWVDRTLDSLFFIEKVYLFHLRQITFPMLPFPCTFRIFASCLLVLFQRAFRHDPGMFL